MIWDYICDKCGESFDADEIKSVKESTGEEWGVCPYCGSYDYSEAKRCDLCGEVHKIEEIHEGVCDECLDEQRYEVKMCYDIGNDSPQEVKINELITCLLSDKEINDILYNWIMGNAKYTKIDCRKFIEQDKDWFAEHLLERMNRR